MYIFLLSFVISPLSFYDFLFLIYFFIVVPVQLSPLYDFIYLDSFLFFFDEFGWRFVNLVYLFKEQAFKFIDFFGIIFLDYISFLSSLILISSFLLLTLGFVYCSFSSSFKCEVRLCIWAFSYFLRQAGNAIYFPLRIAFPVSYRFWIVVSSFLFVSRYLLISSLISLFTHSLCNKILFTSISLHVFSVQLVIYFYLFNFIHSFT